VEKIKKSRDESKKKIAASSAEHSGLTASTDTASETYGVNLEPQGSCDTGERIRSGPDRSPGQWKTICKWGLCAGCLTRTIPPHKPGSDGAPCKGQPYALFEEVDISRVEKGLSELRAGPKRTRGKHGQQDRHNRPGNVSSTARQPGHTVVASQFPFHRGLSHTKGSFFVQGHGYGVPATPPYLFAFSAPAFNFHQPSSYRRLERSSKYDRCTVTASSGSVTQISATDEPCIARTPQYSHASMTTNVKRFAERNIDIMGIHPPTPVIPEIHIEVDIGPTYTSPQKAAVMPCPESSKSAFGLTIHDPDWDGETRVAGSIHGQADTAEEDLSTSALLVEKLLRKTERIMSSAPRSWTLQLTPVSFNLFYCLC